MKTILIPAIAFFALTGAAPAQEPPVLIGNYDAAVLDDAAGSDAPPSAISQPVTARHSISTARRDGVAGPGTSCMYGNYGPAVCDEVQSGR